MMWSHIFCVFIFPWDTVAENLCTNLTIKNFYIHNEVLTAEENTTVNISISFENNSCLTKTTQLLLTVESFDNQWKVYKKSCTFLQSKHTCSSALYSTVQCVCGSSELYFIKTLNRADKTQWRWTSFNSNNISDSIIILFNVTHPSLLTNLTINGYSGTKLLKQNESANIVCEWQNSSPPTATRLVKNNITLMESNDTGSITYTLPAVRCSDASAIKCETGNKDQLTVLLLVECPPEFLNSSAEMQTITVGHMLRIHVPVRTHTTEIKQCEITQLIKYSSKNYSEAQILKVLNPQSLHCSTFTATDKEQCFCSLTGTPPNLIFTLYLMNVTEEYNGVWQARITNGIGTGQVSLSLQLSGVRRRSVTSPYQTTTPPRTESDKSSSKTSSYNEVDDLELTARIREEADSVEYTRPSPPTAHAHSTRTALSSHAERLIAVPQEAVTIEQAARAQQPEYVEIENEVRPNGDDGYLVPAGQYASLNPATRSEEGHEYENLGSRPTESSSTPGYSGLVKSTKREKHLYDRLRRETNQTIEAEEEDPTYAIALEQMPGPTFTKL